MRTEQETPKIISSNILSQQTERMYIFLEETRQNNIITPQYLVLNRIQKVKLKNPPILLLLYPSH